MKGSNLKVGLGILSQGLKRVLKVSLNVPTGQQLIATIQPLPLVWTIDIRCASENIQGRSGAGLQTNVGEIICEVDTRKVRPGGRPGRRADHPEQQIGEERDGVNDSTRHTVMGSAPTESHNQQNRLPSFFSSRQCTSVGGACPRTFCPCPFPFPPESLEEHVRSWPRRIYRALNSITRALAGAVLQVLLLFPAKPFQRSACMTFFIAFGGAEGATGHDGML